jgi:hypothetical protein
MKFRLHINVVKKVLLHKCVGSDQWRQGIRLQIKELRNSLRDIIEPDSSLLTRLLSKTVLTYDQFLLIHSKTNVLEKNDELLRCLLDYRCTGDLYEVMKVFEELGQKHVVNFVWSGGSKCICQCDFLRKLTRHLFDAV